MRTLILGAGATGGYFGGRLLETGADVTFLVRSKRAEKLKKNGLVIKSKLGDASFPDVKAITAAVEPFDLVILSCKAYDLDDAIATIRPAVGANSTVLPLLNGMRHIEKLQASFSPQNVIGGFCVIAATMDNDGKILHLNDAHGIKYGELDGTKSERVEKIDAMFQPANCKSEASQKIKMDMWEKWVMISSLAALTTLMRANVGEVARAPGGKEIAAKLFAECLSVANAYECEPDAKFKELMGNRLSDTESTLAASMCRDIENGNDVESEQIIGDLIDRARAKGVKVPLLELVYCNLKAYENHREALLKK